MGWTTSTIRSRSAISAWITSPARTFVDGFAGLPLTRTCPPSHSWVAIGRVFTRRTAYSQRSIRVSSGIGCSHAAGVGSGPSSAVAVLDIGPRGDVDAVVLGRGERPPLRRVGLIGEASAGRESGGDSRLRLVRGHADIDVRPAAAWLGRVQALE